MMKPIHFANTLALVQLIIHPFLHFWYHLHAASYEGVMGLLASGVQLSVQGFHFDLPRIALGMAADTAVIWLLGFVSALIYQRFKR